MDGGVMMMLMSGLDALANLAVALIPFAIWQRTKITGFAIVGASFAATALMVLIGGWVFAVAGGSMAAMYVWRGVGLLITLAAAFGFWRIYEAVRTPAAAPGP